MVHTLVGKEGLAILLRGQSPIVFCPARSLARLRLLMAWQKALADGRRLQQPVKKLAADVRL